ncbi:MAG: RadC family protein [Clostridia bacterium]|nr:RadC family protein [Clostridia bacterium]
MSKSTAEKNIHAGHRKRVKANVYKNGFEQLEDHRLLELLLFYSIPREDTNEIAHRLLNEFGSFTNIIKASPKKLSSVMGIGENTAILLSAMGELCSRAVKEDIIKKPSYKKDEDLYKLISSFYLNEENEKLSIACFDSGMKLKGIDFISEGDSIRTDFDFKVFLSKVIEYDPAFVVLAHNHPGAESAPSAADIDTTASASVTLRKIGVVLADHIIIGKDSVYSMRKDMRFSQFFTN